MNLDTLLHKRDTRRSWRVASHILFWMTYFGCTVYLNKIPFNPYGNVPLSWLAPLWNTLALMIVYYPLVYLVGAKLFSQKRWIPAIGSSLLLFLLYTLLDYTGEILVFSYCEACNEAIARVNSSYHQYLQSGFFNIMISRVLSGGLFFQLLIGLTLPLAIKAALGYHRYWLQNMQLARDNVQLELDFLKAQVNPHFLFNTLNNLYGLIIHQRNDQSAETVALLSDFMRYTLYDTSVKSIALEKEISQIRNYIALEQLRLNHTKVVFDCTTDGKDYALPPLLFMPLVENAFKYHVDSSSQGALINIKLHVEKGLLYFSTENRFDPARKQGQAGGIGLANLQKRLFHYFPGKNTYQASTKGSTYTAHLTLELL